jgi:hypothetical protein
MSQKTALHMKWHADRRTKGGVLRHPTDGLAWKDFDERYPEFASDPRNIRFGLSSDGFNPFGNMSSTHSDGDQGTTSKDLIQVPIGPITRARAKKFKDVLNGLIQELWAQINSLRPIEHDPQWQQRIVTLIQVLEG